MNKLDDEIKVADPGAGALLSFDALGEGFVLTTEGRPQDFVGVDRRTKEDRALCCIAMREMWPRHLRMPKRVRAALPWLSRQGEAAKRAWRRRRQLLWRLLLLAGAFALTVMIAMIFPGQWVDRWSGWLFIAMPAILVATLVSSRKKSRSES